MDLETIKKAKYITIDRDVPEKGLWKITDKFYIKDEHGNVLVVRMVIDKDLSKAGDERIVEWQQEAAREISILSIFNTFPRAEAESWPPPRGRADPKDGDPTRDDGEPYKMGINQNGVRINFVSLNTTKGKDHDPFTGFVNHKLINHWEYQNEAGDKFLQVYEDEAGMVSISTGYAVNEAYIKIV
jgi:hypothetical protein